MSTNSHRKDLRGVPRESSGPHVYESIREVSDRTGIPVQTIYNMRWRGEGPPAFKVGRRLLFRPEDVDAWIASHAPAGAPTSIDVDGSTAPRAWRP